MRYISIFNLWSQQTVMASSCKGVNDVMAICHSELGGLLWLWGGTVVRADHVRVGVRRCAHDHVRVGVSRCSHVSRAAGGGRGTCISGDHIKLFIAL